MGAAKHRGNMKKRRIIISVVVLILIVVGGLIYFLKPVTLLEKRINRQIAANMQENGLAWEIVLYDLYYEFPYELKGKAYLRNASYNCLIDVNKLILQPHFRTLYKRTQLYDISGNALGGSFEGHFALGKNDDFNLHFQRLSSRHIKEMSSGQPLESNTAVTVSGAINIAAGTVRADTNIDSIKITLPEPLSLSGDLYFYDGQLNFEAADNMINLKQALITNSDAEIAVTGKIAVLNKNESQLDLYGVLVVRNPVLAYILNLSKEGENDSPEFRFRITGSSRYPSFRLIPPEGETTADTATPPAPAFRATEEPAAAEGGEN